MAVTLAGTCNVALGLIGQKQFVTTLADNTPQAINCAVFFQKTRGEVLEAFEWRWATRRATLAVISTAARTGWEYVYAAPADMVRPRFIYAGTLTPSASQRVAYDIEDGNTDTTGRVILTDEEDAELVYVADLGIGYFTQLAADAVSWQLAVYLCSCMPVKPAVAKGLQDEANRRLAKAIAADLRNEQKAQQPESDVILARS